MKKHLLAVGFLSVILLSAAERTITNAWVIRCPEPANITEKFAAEQLQKYIAAATGMKLKTASSGSPAVILRTDAALDREEWDVTAEKSGDLLIRWNGAKFVNGNFYLFQSHTRQLKRTPMNNGRNNIGKATSCIARARQDNRHASDSRH